MSKKRARQTIKELEKQLAAESKKRALAELENRKINSKIIRLNTYIEFSKSLEQISRKPLIPELIKQAACKLVQDAFKAGAIQLSNSITERPDVARLNLSLEILKP